MPGILTIEALFDLPNGWVGDDGWYIDNVQVSNTLLAFEGIEDDDVDRRAFESMFTAMVESYVALHTG